MDVGPGGGQAAAVGAVRPGRTAVRGGGPAGQSCRKVWLWGWRLGGPKTSGADSAGDLGCGRQDGVPHKQDGANRLPIKRPFKILGGLLRARNLAGNVG